MHVFNPYEIRHIQLDKLNTDTFSFYLKGAGYYCVFWWKHFPLGHLFIHEQDDLTDHVLQQKVLDVIAPTINFYSQKHLVPVGNYVNDFLNYKYDNFNHVMNSIFAGYAVSRPGSVLDVSVIICTCNRSALLQKCLESLSHQQFLPKEVIVIDNAPSDDRTKQLVSHFKDVVYIAEPKKGLSIARNAALKRARGSIIAFVDDDVILHPLWLYWIYDSFKDPGVDAMTGLVMAKSLSTESQFLFEKDWSFNRGYQEKTFDAEYLKKHLLEGPPVWEIGAGANMAFRKKVLDETGYFNEQLGAGAAGCSEDSELWFRILSMDYSIIYNPRAVVFHEHRNDFKSLYNQLFNYMRGHTVAALIQQEQNRTAGYKRYVFNRLVREYLTLLVKGTFKSFTIDKLLLVKIHGMLSGLLYYFNNRKKPIHFSSYSVILLLRTWKLQH